MADFDQSDTAGVAADLVTAGLSLVETIISMIRDAQQAKSEEHAAIIAKFERAEAALTDVAKEANDVLDELEHAAQEEKKQ
jgi:uncharacterized protein (UPF0212 family)